MNGKKYFNEEFVEEIQALNLTEQQLEIEKRLKFLRDDFAPTYGFEIENILKCKNTWDVPWDSLLDKQPIDELKKHLNGRAKQIHYEGTNYMSEAVVPVCYSLSELFDESSLLLDEVKGAAAQAGYDLTSHQAPMPSKEGKFLYYPSQYGYYLKPLMTALEEHGDPSLPYKTATASIHQHHGIDSANRYEANKFTVAIAKELFLMFDDIMLAKWHGRHKTGGMWDERYNAWSEVVNTRSLPNFPEYLDYVDSESWEGQSLYLKSILPFDRLHGGEDQIQRVRTDIQHLWLDETVSYFCKLYGMNQEKLTWGLVDNLLRNHGPAVLKNPAKNILTNELRTADSVVENVGIEKTIKMYASFYILALENLLNNWYSLRS